MNYSPTKAELVNDYFKSNLTYQEIADKYGYKTRQVVTRWFKKYDIQPKSKSQLATENFEKNTNIISKEELESLYKENSISKIAKKLNVSRGIISKWLSDYGIENTYFKYHIDNDILIKELNNLSLKEIELEYSYPIQELKRRKLNIIELPKIEYNTDRLKQIILLYDVNNQGFSKQIINDDPNVYASILENTKIHKLQSNKITERVYRIINDMGPDDVQCCKKCNVQLKFYTLQLGYGNSSNNICNNCVSAQSASSIPSQELFWKIHNLVENKEDCYFGELNYEKTIYVNKKDKEKFKDYPKLNKIKYTRELGKELWLVGENNGNYLENVLFEKHVKHFPSTWKIEDFILKSYETAGIQLESS